MKDRQIINMDILIRNLHTVVSEKEFPVIYESLTYARERIVEFFVEFENEARALGITADPAQGSRNDQAMPEEDATAALALRSSYTFVPEAEADEIYHQLRLSRMKALT